MRGGRPLSVSVGRPVWSRLVPTDPDWSRLGLRVVLICQGALATGHWPAHSLRQSTEYHRRLRKLLYSVQRTAGVTLRPCLPRSTEASSVVPTTCYDPPRRAAQRIVPVPSLHAEGKWQVASAPGTRAQCSPGQSYRLVSTVKASLQASL